MILKNCRLLPQLSPFSTVTAADVELKEGTIKRISMLPIGGEEIVDCGGKTLLPGLIDLHTHISGLCGPGAAAFKTPMKALVEYADQTRRYLDYGFTTIRDCGALGRVANFVRDMVHRDICEGPQIIASGLILTPTEVEESDEIYDMYVNCDSPDDFRRAVRKEVAEHADFIKVMASGSAFHPTGIPVQPVLTRQELQAAVDGANLKGTYVAAHAHGDEAIRVCIETGVKTIEHATYIGEETLQLLLATEGCYLVPTLAAMHVSHPEGEEGGFWVKRLGEMLNSCAENIEKVYRAGCKLGFGTDSTVTMDQYEQGLEFKYRKEYCHMENMDILLQATRYSAEIAGLGNCIGQVREGLQADLILVDGNPDTDMAVMYKKPLKVWKRGRLVRGA